MVLESTMICVDNSDYMRNGDFLPTRLQAQQEAVNLVCHTKTRSNPENNVGLLTLANVEVLATLTSDVGRILSKLHRVQPNGNINLLTGIRIAHLALKHRQGKNHKMRIIVFVGSPVETDEKELVKLAKRLKKEKVNVDIVSFGEDTDNNACLTVFINTLNGKDGTTGGSHLVAVPAGGCVVLSEALISSPIVGGEGGAGPSGSGMSQFEFGVDPNEDPELALALRVSMEEQRQRQEEESRRQQTSDPSTEGAASTNQESGMMGRALAMSLEREAMDLSEEEQIALAMQMSMQQETGADESMDVSEEYAEVINDPAFLQSILENLPGVDPQSEAIRQAVTTLKNTNPKDSPKDEKDKDKDKEPTS